MYTKTILALLLTTPFMFISSKAMSQDWREVPDIIMKKMLGKKSIEYHSFEADDDVSHHVHYAFEKPAGFLNLKNSTKKRGLRKRFEVKFCLNTGSILAVRKFTYRPVRMRI